jgi:hypothetical protein
VVPAAGAAAAAAAADVPAAAAAPAAAAVPDDWEAEDVTAAVKHNSCKGPADRWQRLSGKAAKVIQFALNGGGDEGNARRRARKKEARARKRITRACRQMLKEAKQLLVMLARVKDCGLIGALGNTAALVGLKLRGQEDWARAIADTGAAASLLPLKTMQMVHFSQRPALRQSTTRLKGVNGGGLQVHDRQDRC